jgi:hypothetical protein
VWSATCSVVSRATCASDAAGAVCDAAGAQGAGVCLVPLAHQAQWVQCATPPGHREPACVLFRWCIRRSDCSVRHHRGSGSWCVSCSACASGAAAAVCDTAGAQGAGVCLVPLAHQAQRLQCATPPGLSEPACVSTACSDEQHLQGDDRAQWWLYSTTWAVSDCSS